MTKSTITRERLLEIIVTGPEASGAEQNELARMALAAMDSEPVHSKPDIADAIYEAFIVVCECHPDGVSILRNARKYIDKIRHSQPAPVVPDEMTTEQAYEIGDYHGDPVDVFVRGANWMRQHIIDSTLATTSQEDKE